MNAWFFWAMSNCILAVHGRQITHGTCVHVVCLRQSSSIRIIRIIFLESYARILTYETLSYVNHIVAWYFRPVQGSSSLDFNHETFTQNRNNFAISNTPLLPVYLKQIFLWIPVEGLLRRLSTAADFFGSAMPPSGTGASLWRPSVWTLSFLLTCVIIRVSYAFFIFLTIRTYFNVWYYIIRVWSSTGLRDMKETRTYKLC